jgi:monofunctional biosynthetic peptidoglycan transglycosylase
MTDYYAALLSAVLPNPHHLQVDHPSAYVGERQAWILKQIRRLQREQWLLHIDSIAARD